MPAARRGDRRVAELGVAERRDWHGRHAIHRRTWLGTAACLGLVAGVSLACAAWASRRGWPLAIALPVAWVVFEGVQGWPLGGLPWMPLGLSQHSVSGVASWAATIGTVGLSGAVVLTNVVLAGR